MAGFSRAIGIEHSDGDAETETFTLDLDPQWSVGGKPNGGYLLAAAANAGAYVLNEMGSAHLHPIASSAHYLKAPEIGPVEIAAELLRMGRSGSQVRATMSQNGEACVEALINYATLPEVSAPWWSDGNTVPLLDFDSCVELSADPPGADFRVTIMEVVSERLDPSCLGFAAGTPTGLGELRGWLSFRDGRSVDPLALLFAVDAFPPAIFDLGYLGWVPTLQLSVYVRALPVPGPLKIRQRTRVIENGTLDEVCEIWDSADRLVAHSTQLAGFREPAIS